MSPVALHNQSHQCVDRSSDSFQCLFPYFRLHLELHDSDIHHDELPLEPELAAACWMEDIG